MAELTIGKWKIVPNDGGGWTVGEPKTIRKKDSPDYGKEYLANCRWPGNLEACILWCREQHIKDADGEGVETILQAIRDFNAMLSGLFTLSIREPGR